MRGYCWSAVACGQQSRVVGLVARVELTSSVFSSSWFSKSLTRASIPVLNAMNHSGGPACGCQIQSAWGASSDGSFEAVLTDAPGVDTPANTCASCSARAMRRAVSIPSMVLRASPAPSRDFLRSCHIKPGGRLGFVFRRRCDAHRSSAACQTKLQAMLLPCGPRKIHDPSQAVLAGRPRAALRWPGSDSQVVGFRLLAWTEARS